MSNTKTKFLGYKLKIGIFVVLLFSLTASMCLNIVAFQYIQSQNQKFPWIVIKGYVTEAFTGEPIDLATVSAYVGGEGEIPYSFSVSKVYTDADGFYRLETPVYRDYFEIVCSFSHGLSKQGIVTLTEKEAVKGDWDSRLWFNQNFSVLLNIQYIPEIEVD